ncbi:uncharacterized protein Bfra_003211 [Botrytis fragariae]|uniref:Uncharacterized protein n=1 Tax=Botrytis fragariae TaxID=1964551 RepID=A0A8H6AZS6_9HELO|nr:uncharacterized protein Bfra_003211 [Botrytis fragariae]KAF5876803.1 hypothetical protein Bfra_003211 [Botrytis fragariae]
MTNPANMTSPQVHQCISSLRTSSYHLSLLSRALTIFTIYLFILMMITRIPLLYPTSNYKTVTSQILPWKNTAKIIVALMVSISLDPDFLIYYVFYQIGRKLLAISLLETGGKLKLLAVMITVKPCWLLIGAAYEIGEVCVDITLEHFQKPFGVEKKNAAENEKREENPHSANYPEPISAIISYMSSLLDGIQYNIVTGSEETHPYKKMIWKLKEIQKSETDADNKKEMKISSDLRHSENQPPLSQTRKHLWLNFVDFDTEEETQDSLDKHSIADETISPTFSLSPLQSTKPRSTIIVSLPSPLRSRLREMIDSVTRDLNSVERHNAVRIIIETEQNIEKLYSISESNMPRMIEQLEGLERKLEDIFENVEMAAVENEVSNKDENEGEDEEEEMEPGLLTPSTSSGEWTSVESPSTPSAHSEPTFEDDAEDKKEDMPSDSLTPSTYSTPSIPSSPSSQSRSSPSPTTTITGRPWHLFLVDTLYKCDNSLHFEWSTAELFNAWFSKNFWFAVTEGEIELLEKWKSWALDDRPVDQKWNW